MMEATVLLRTFTAEEVFFVAFPSLCLNTVKGPWCQRSRVFTYSLNAYDTFCKNEQINE